MRETDVTFGSLIKGVTVATIGVAFIYTIAAAFYKVVSIKVSGLPLDAVPLQVLIIDAMQLHVSALHGAIGGFALGLAEWLFRYFRQRRNAPVYADPDMEETVDQTIQNIRRAKADAYLDTHHKTPRPSGQDPQPTVENIITAQDGRYTYRVMAHRHLSEAELMEIVRDALNDGTVIEPERGGTATLTYNGP